MYDFIGQIVRKIVVRNESHRIYIFGLNLKNFFIEEILHKNENENFYFLHKPK